MGVTVTDTERGDVDQVVRALKEVLDEARQAKSKA
jgi:hypothetical protein